MKKAFFPLDILLTPIDHHNHPSSENVFRKCMFNHKFGRSFNFCHNLEAVYQSLSDSFGNTVIIDSGFELERSEYSVETISEFVLKVRENYPKVAFVFMGDEFKRCEMIKANQRFEHYLFYQYSNPLDSADLLRGSIILDKCVEWLYEQYEYDLCFSFAGEDREVAEALATAMRKSGARVFYDQFEQANLLGRNLYDYLYDIYFKKSRYCVLLASQNYSAKLWTNYERRAIQERLFQNLKSDYVIPIKLDNSPITSLPETIGYAAIGLGIERIAELLKQKLAINGIEKPNKKEFSNICY